MMIMMMMIMMIAIVIIIIAINKIIKLICQTVLMNMARVEFWRQNESNNKKYNPEWIYSNVK